MKNVIQHTILLMKSLRSEFGDEEGQRIFENVSSMLPDEVNHGVLEHVLTVRNAFSNDYECEVYLTAIDNDALHAGRVLFVKTLRAHTKLSLKDAVDALKDLVAGNRIQVTLKENINTAATTLSRFGILLTY